MKTDGETSRENSREKTIEFKALTDGLGFHPFSNGLPYAPVSPNASPKATPKPNFESGSGAYSAGRPTFINPQKVVTPQKVQVPRAQAQPQVQIQTPLLQVEHHYGFEYIARRFLAYFVDSFLNMSLGAGAMFLVLWKQENNLESLLNPSILIVSIVFLIFFNWAIFTAKKSRFIRAWVRSFSAFNSAAHSVQF